jgi:hypothetical protein
VFNFDDDLGGRGLDLARGATPLEECGGSAEAASCRGQFCGRGTNSIIFMTNKIYFVTS